jgi:hypothetical protein
MTDLDFNSPAMVTNKPLPELPEFIKVRLTSDAVIALNTGRIVLIIPSADHNKYLMTSGHAVQVVEIIPATVVTPS